jgi:hypothetical protein
MTVPGKGGRPRKWRSDADRVRAFRARHRGEEEPATFDEALVDFSARYADQNEMDYEAFVKAVRSGRLEAIEGV